MEFADQGKYAKDSIRVFTFTSVSLLAEVDSRVALARRVRWGKLI